ncbi:MAG: DUF192 domain-containing protein [Gammaproteobacteria bacterium]
MNTTAAALRRYLRALSTLLTPPRPLPAQIACRVTNPATTLRRYLRAQPILLTLLTLLTLPPPLFAQSACRAANPGMANMRIVRIALLDAQRRRVEVRAHIADENFERADGYQHICPAVIRRSAILFRFDAPLATRFHMHNVHAPLDIGFFDARGVLLQSMVMRPYADGAEVLYAPMRKFQYALEARAGFFAEKKLAAGVTRLLLESLP